MAAKGGGSGSRNALVFLLALISIVAIVAVALRRNTGAPDAGDDREPTPVRRLEREAPPRRPITLERSETPEGAVNVLMVVPAEADAYVASEWPDQNFGMDALYLGYSLDERFGAERVFLRFDVEDTVPPGSVVNRAGLRLHVRLSLPPDDAPMGTVIRHLISSWDEMGVTWGNRPRWGPIRAVARVPSAPRWTEWDVTDLVGDWVSGAIENHGMLILGDEALRQRERAYYSRETPQEGAAGQFYPQLILEYTDFNDEEAPVTEVAALPRYVGSDFVVSWSGEDRGGAGIAFYDVAYRVDGSEWRDWLTDVAFTSATFEGGENGQFYEFRARARDRAGNVEPSGPAEASATVDDQPPTSSVHGLPVIEREAAFNVAWSGRDGGSGIRYYDVRYRVDGGDWIPWQQRTLATDAVFTALVDGQYAFEVRAVDQLGNQERFLGRPEASVTVDARAPFVQP
jgi:hypothetical protein